MVAASFTGCDRWLTVAILTVGVGLNGGIYSGFKVNHLDISPRFAGILMSFTNCLANLAGLLAPIYAGNIIYGEVFIDATPLICIFFLILAFLFCVLQPSQAKWRIVFLTAAGVYAGCCTFYNFFGSGVRQPWDNPQDGNGESNNSRDPERAVTQDTST